jgi:hypothetical protein
MIWTVVLQTVALVALVALFLYGVALYLSSLWKISIARKCKQSEVFKYALSLMDDSSSTTRKERCFCLALLLETPGLDESFGLSIGSWMVRC